MTRREITRQQALDWNENWDPSDLAIITGHLERLAVKSFYVTDSGACVNCKSTEEINDRSRNVMFLYPGYLWFPEDLIAESDRSNALYPGIVLSTFRDRHPSEMTHRIEAQTCPNCFIDLPLSGGCDTCGYLPDPSTG